MSLGEYSRAPALLLDDLELLREGAEVWQKKEADRDRWKQGRKEAAAGKFRRR